MELIGSLFTALFVALFLGVAVTFGFAFMLWFIGVGIILAAAILLREWWRRWIFLRDGKAQETRSEIHIIEADYEDISDKR